MKNYDVLYIGNYTKDTIISPAGTKYVDGGAVNYAAHAAAQLGMKVAVVTRLAKEDDRVVDKFTQAGIDCFVTYTPQSTLMKLEYPTTDPDIRSLSVSRHSWFHHSKRRGKNRLQSCRGWFKPAWRSWHGCYSQTQRKEHARRGRYARLCARPTWERIEV